MTVYSLARSVIERIVGKFGYVLKESERPPRGFDGFVTWLKKQDFYPETVIDVGVGNGTPWLHEGFARSQFVLVEPNVQFEPDLQRICRNLNADYHIFAAGPETGTAKLRVNEVTPTSSGLLDYSSDFASRQNRDGIANVESYHEVQIQPLDCILTDETKSPILLKIDVEGFELEVLKGATEILDRTDVVILEVSVLKRHVGEVEIPELFQYLSDRGFDLLDIIDTTTIGSNKRLAYFDVAFVRRGASLAAA